MIVPIFSGTAILTVPDFLKQIRQAFTGDDPKYYILPDSKEMTAQLLLLYENSGPDEDLSDLKDFDEKKCLRF